MTLKGYGLIIVCILAFITGFGLIVSAVTLIGSKLPH